VPGVSVLSKSLVDKLGEKPTGQFTGFRMIGERLDVQLYTISELRVGPMVQNPGARRP
jgi:aromatic ring-cleaving dioxygenase